MSRLPEIYERFSEEYPVVSNAYSKLGTTIHESGSLDERSRCLVKLGIAIGAESEGAVRSHVRKAFDAGLTRADVEHAILLSLTTVGFPRMIAALQWSRGVPEPE